MTSRFTLACCAVLLAAGAFAQDPPARGASLLAEARTAVGGDDRLRAVKTLQARGDFKRMVGQSTIEGEVTLIAEFPGKLRREEDLSLPGGGPAIVRTEVINGSETWEENTGGGGGQFVFRGRGGGDVVGPGRDGGGGRGRGAIDPEQLRQFQLRARQADLARLSLALLLATSDPVTWVGTAESPDGRADVLEIKPAEGAALRLFLDQESHLPLMITWQGIAPQIRIARRGGGPGAEPVPDRPLPDRPPQATLRMTLGDYKTVNGLKLPHFITRGVDDATTEEWTISSYRINPALKADTFIRK
jgi:hypothetical protein